MCPQTQFTYDPSGNLIRRMPGGSGAPTIKNHPASKVVAPGATASFSVVVGHVAGTTFQWCHNDAPIPGATTDTLLLPNVSDADAGQYTVTVTTALGIATSNPAHLSVLALDDPARADESLSVTVYADPGGAVTVTPLKRSYESGDALELAATEAPPKRFVGWAGDVVGSANPMSLVVTHDMTIRARFACPVPPPSGLVAFWRGEEDANDIVGRHHGVFCVGMSPVAARITTQGKVGGAFAFDGSVHISVPPASDLAPDEITVEGWIFPSADNIARQAIVAQASSAAEDATWLLAIVNGKPSFRSKHNGFGAMLLEAPSPIPLNAWTHLAITFDGMAKAIYINGAQVALQGGLGPLAYEPSPGPITIGSNGADKADVKRFVGYIDEVALYGRALTLTEVFDIYTADFAGKDMSRPYFTSPTMLPHAGVGQEYTQDVRTVCGVTPVTFSVTKGVLPPGITLSPAGSVSGTPTAIGTFSFYIRAMDATGNTTERLCVMRVLESLTRLTG